MPKGSEKACNADTPLPALILDFLRQYHPELLTPKDGDVRGGITCACVTHKMTEHQQSPFCGGNQKEPGTGGGGATLHCAPSTST